MKDYKKALDCLNYLVQFIREIENPSIGSTSMMFDKDGEVIMRTDIGYWVQGNNGLRSYLMEKATEVIPIEWLEDYIIPFQAHYDGLSEEQKENSGAGWVIDILNEMLDDWRKENEVNR